MSLVLGIDPGLSGALALYDPEGGLLDVLDVPVIERSMAKGRVKRSVDPYEAARLIDSWAPDIGLVVIERVGIRPGEGAVGAFSFGDGFGLLKGICYAHFFRVELVTPQVWRRSMGVKGDKDESRARASQLLPRSAGYWNLKKHDGRAEAALIAMYGARLLKEAA